MKLKSVALTGILTLAANAAAVEQSICFSQEMTNSGKYRFGIAKLGDDITLNGGFCQGKTLPQMNKEGWKVIQVVTGLNQSFGMVMEKAK